MGSVIGSCVGSFAASCGCAAINSCGSGVDPRIPYLILFFLTFIAAAVLRYWNKPVAFHLPVYNEEIGCTDPKCYGEEAVYRVMFASFIFFSVMGFIMKIGSCANSGFDKGYWIIKYLLMIGLVVVGYLLPPQVVEAYRIISIFVSAMFLVIQIILLVDFAYSWNTSWLDKGWKIPVLIFAVFGYVASLTALILFFKFYNNNVDGCYTTALTVVTLLSTLGFSGLSMTEWSQHGAILPSSVVTVYSYWILYTALSDGPCGEQYKKQSVYSVVFGFVLMGFSLIYSGWSVSSQVGHSKQASVVEDGENSMPDYEAVSDIDDQKTSMVEGDDEDQHSSAPSNPASFHFVMAASACYATMLLTSWGTKQDNASLSAELTAMWIKMASQWICMLLYTWSLMAPYVLTNRSFD